MGNNDKRHTGMVNWFDNQRGYGFIKMDDDPEDAEYFVHFKNIVSKKSYKTLKAGQKVSFTLEETSKGIQAVGVEVVE